MSQRHTTLGPEVLERARNGDADAYLALVRRYNKAMGSIARRWLSDDAVVDEVVQETWEAVLRGLESFEGRSKLSTWIFAIVANKARSRLRKEQRSVPFSSLDHPDGDHERRFTGDGHWLTPPAPWTRPADAIVSDRRLYEQVLQFLDELPAAQRAVVELRDVQGEDAETVCNVLGLSASNQRVLLHRGRVKLRARLEALLSES